MARRLRVEYPGAIYHVTCRMIGDKNSGLSLLFVDDGDRERFVDRLGERVEQHKIRLYQFVCMTNHFHLVFETPAGNCSKFMQSLSTAYTVYYNLRHRRHGHLLDGRYKAKAVEGDEYLLGLSRYVHLNPVQVGRVKERPIAEKIEYLREYRWSTYRSYIGRAKRLGFVEYGPILGEMGGKRRERAKRYREFVEGGLAGDDKDMMEMMKESPLSIGGDGFRAWIDKLYHGRVEGAEREEDAAFRRMTEPLGADVVLRTVGEVFGVEAEEFRRRRRESPLRAAAARFLGKYAGQSQRETADYLDIGSGSAVSKQGVRHREKLESDRRLGRQMRECEERLARLERERHARAACR